MTPSRKLIGRSWIAERPAALWELTALIVFAAAYGGIEFTRGTSRIAAIWPANAALLTLMLAFPRARVASLAAAGYVGMTGANLALDSTTAVTFCLPVANLVEVAICLAALRRLGDHDLTRPRTLAIFCVVAAGPAALASSAIAVALFGLASPPVHLGTLFWNWYAADALGLVTFTPLFWSLATRPIRLDRERLPAALFSAAAFAAVLGAIFLQSSYPLLFLVYPALIVVAFQFGFGGVAAALVLTATIALVATTNGVGPLSLMRGSLREQVAILQVFVAVSAAMSLAVAAVLAEREKLNRQLRAAKITAEAAEDRLRDSEARYRLLAENAADVIALRGVEGRVEYVSPSVAQLLGHRPEAFAALGLESFLRPEDEQTLAALIGGLSPERPNATKVLRMRRADGGWIWVEGAFAYVPAPAGAKTLAVLRDAEQRKAYEAELETARQSAEEALKVKSEFLATMSHELRTPLNGILGFSELLIESGELRSPEGQRYARHVETSSRALLSIVNDVMDVSKLEAGAIELDPRAFSLRELLDGAAGVLRGEAERKGLAMSVVVEERVPDLLVGDDARLRQVLLNLLSNAVKFTPAGSVTLRANGESLGEGLARLSLVVEDTGIGVPEDKAHRLFQRFSQVDQTTSRRYGGTGLGLSICKNLVELMGGEISMTSAERVGSAFTVALTLPLGSSARRRKTAKPCAPTVARGSLRALVAEDVEMNRELIATLMARWGHEADLVADGEEAVARATVHEYDIIVMDVQMPGVDGLEAARRIRALGGRAGATPIIALTADVLPEAVAYVREAGMDAHLGKPFSPEELRSLIETRARRGRSRVPSAKKPAPAGDGAKADEDLLHQATLDELVAFLGEAPGASFLDRLDRQMSAVFASPPRNRDDLPALRYEAHALASTSGMMGFRRLQAACLALEAAIEQAQGDITADALLAFAEARAARDASEAPLAAARASAPLRAAG